MKKALALALLTFALLLAFGCSKPAETPASGTATEQATPAAAPEAPKAANEVNSFDLMTLATTDQAKFEAEYVGKTIVIKNLVVYGVNADSTPPELITFPYDPATETVWTDKKAQIGGKPFKGNGKSDNILIKFVNVEDVKKMKDPEIIGSGAQEFNYGAPFSVEAKIVEYAGGIVAEGGKLVP